MVKEIEVIITKEDFSEDHIVARVIHKKFKQAGIPVNPIGVNPVVYSGNIYREIEEEQIKFIWRDDESN